MKLFKSIFFLLALLVLVGCQDRGGGSTPSAEFTKETAKGVYANGQQTFVYNDVDHQMASNSRMNMFRYQTHSQDLYLNMTLSKSSPAVKEILTVTVDSKGVKDIESGSYTVEVLRKASSNSEELMWLWCSEKSIGFILPDSN